MKNTQDYFPHVDAKLSQWAQNLKAKLPRYEVSLGLTKDEVTAINQFCDDIIQAILDGTEAAATAKKASAKKILAVAAAEKGLRPLIKRAKTAPGNTLDIDKDLGIVGEEISHDWDTYKPLISAEAHPGYVHIDGKKHGVQGFNIYMRLKGESVWNKEAFVSHLPFMDHHPAHTPGQSENREYMAIGVIQDTEIGQMSNIASVAFAG